MNRKTRYGAYLITGSLIVLTLLLGYPGVDRSKAEANRPSDFAADIVGIKTYAPAERIFTPSPDGLKTWDLFNSWHNDRSNCSPFFATSKGWTEDEEVPAGQVLVGYINHYDGGSGPFPCEDNSKSIYRGAISFDITEKVKGAPVLSATKATLKFTVVAGGVAAYDGSRKPIAKVCEDQLFVSGTDWVKGFARGEPPPIAGDLIASIKECAPVCSIDVTKQVNDWIAGKKDRSAFVIVGEDENWLDKLIPHDNSVCQTRYGDFTLTVDYPTLVDTPTTPTVRAGCTNFALASNGGVATAQNYTKDGVVPGLHFQPSYAIDGVRHTTADGGNYWRDEDPLPSWLQVEFGGPKTIEEVAVFAVADDFAKQLDPSPTDIFKSYGPTAFDVQYWTGTGWENVSAGSIAGNNLVWKRVRFPLSPVTTSKIRVVVNTGSADSVARIVEVEVCGKKSKFGG